MTINTKFKIAQKFIGYCPVYIKAGNNNIIRASDVLRSKFGHKWKTTSMLQQCFAIHDFTSKYNAFYYGEDDNRFDIVKGVKKANDKGYYTIVIEKMKRREIDRLILENNNIKS